MENINDIDKEINKDRLVKKIKALWVITNNIIGYSLIAAIIVFGVLKGYSGTTHFAVFCWAAAVYFFSKYVYLPLFTNKKEIYLSAYKRMMAREYFTSVYGNGSVLYGRFGDKNDLSNQRSNCYSFLSIMYIPFIPTGRYKFLDNRKMIQIDSSCTDWDGDGTYHCWVFKKFDLAEILYIYLKNWSFAVMVIVVFDKIVALYLR